MARRAKDAVVVEVHLFVAFKIPDIHFSPLVLFIRELHTEIFCLKNSITPTLYNAFAGKLNILLSLPTGLATGNPVIT